MIRRVLGVLVALGGLTASDLAWAEGVSTCSVRVGLSESSKPLGALGFTIDYSRVQGTFAGTGSSVVCKSDLAGTGVTVNDQCVGDYAACQWGDGRVLSVALLGSATGMAGPVELLHCDFESATVPTSLDFDVQVVDAGDTDSGPVHPTPLVDILSVDCPQ